MKKQTSILCGLITLSLSGCGGGGGGGDAATAAVAVAQAAAPVISSASTFNISEGQTSIGTALASSTGAYDVITYSLSGTDADSISINSSTGAMSFNTAPDYETKSSYAVKLNAAYVSEINIEETVGFYGVYVRDLDNNKLCFYKMDI